MKLNKKTRLNRRCQELRGAVNPNQARYHCLFTFPIRMIRRSSMPKHRGLKMEKLGRNTSFFCIYTVGLMTMQYVTSSLPNIEHGDGRYN